MVRQFGESRLRPHIAEWFETGEVPVRDLAVEIGKLGLLGMHLEGYGCSGSSATAYGLVCQELEAVDSGLRSLVSVQGSLAMFAIHRWGSEEQREQWLPGHGRGRADRLLRADRAGLRLQPRRHADHGPPRRVRLDPQRVEDVDHQRLDRRRGDRVGARRRGRDRVRGAHVDAGLQRAGDDAQDVAARLGHLGVQPRRRPAARRRETAWGTRLVGSAGLPVRGTVRHRVRRRSARPATAWRRRWTTSAPGRSSTSRWPAIS